MTKYMPNLFIVGQPKAGTTSFAEQLSQHPDIFLPVIKEPHYMCRNEGESWYYYKQPLIYDETNYLRLYKGVTETYRIDATVHYLRFQSAAYEIMKLSPSAKIIVIVREPVSRIVSHYLMDKRGGFVGTDLNQVIEGDSIQKNEYVMCSFSYENIQLYQSLFGKDNVMVIDYSDYAKSNKYWLKQACLFLGLKEIEFQRVISNTYRNPRHIFRYLYRIRSLKLLYGFIAPQKIRVFFRKFIHDTDKPKISLNLALPEVQALIEDYHNTRFKIIEPRNKHSRINM